MAVPKLNVKTNDDSSHGYTARIGTVGEASAGKTTLLYSFLNHGGGPCTTVVESTVRVDLNRLEKEWKFRDEPSIELHGRMIDTMGQEVYAKTLTSIYQYMDIVIFVVDSTQPHTLSRIASYWIPQIIENIRPDREIIYAVALNKMDKHFEEKEMLEAKRQQALRSGGARSVSGGSIIKNNYDSIELARVTKEQVFDTISPLIPINETNIMETSGKYGYNINALFNFLMSQYVTRESIKVRRGLAKLPDREIPARENHIKSMEAVSTTLYSAFAGHFCHTYEAMKAKQEILALGNISDPDHFLSPPTPIHASPHSSPRSTSSPRQQHAPLVKTRSKRMSKKKNQPTDDSSSASSEHQGTPQSAASSPPSDDSFEIVPFVPDSVVKTVIEQREAVKAQRAAAAEDAKYANDREKFVLNTVPMRSYNGEITARKSDAQTGCGC
jgi:small GTP-binding protein